MTTTNPATPILKTNDLRSLKSYRKHERVLTGAEDAVALVGEVDRPVVLVPGDVRVGVASGVAHQQRRVVDLHRLRLRLRAEVGEPRGLGVRCGGGKNGGIKSGGNYIWRREKRYENECVYARAHPVDVYISFLTHVGKQTRGEKGEEEEGRGGGKGGAG